MASPPREAETSLFRPSKKRKIYRQRALDNEEDEDQAAAIATSIPPPNVQSLDELIAGASITGEEQAESINLSVAEILRLRKLRSKRAGGVEFRADAPTARAEEENAIVLRQEQEGDAVKQHEGERKFAPQTGTVGDVNKHMMEYIDSELAKRRRLEAGVQIPSANTPTLHAFGTGNATEASASAGVMRGEVKNSTTNVQRQPAALGKLVEVDLGEEARARNEERTRRKLVGEPVSDEEGKGPKKPTKVRLGRDGKPWRGRKRRNSEDIKRDKMVEDILRENKLDHYEEPIQATSSVNDDEAADDRIADAFRQEFMDAMAQRRQKKTAPPAAASRNAPGKKEEEVLKGPKLGGSRNARAAMRDLMLKQAKK